jgi:hypothetical protein
MAIDKGKDPKPESDKGQDNMLTLIRENRMKEAEKFYKRRGILKPFVDTFRELTEAEKAEFWHDAMVRIKKANIDKKNPYEQGK